MTLPDIWRDVGKRIGFFTKETRRLIPEAPGCYAWFIPLWIYFENLPKMLEVLNKVSLFEPGDDGKATLLARFAWDGVRIEAEKVPTVQVGDASHETWRRVMSDQALRARFQQALMEASIFMPPLYVGKTTNLRVRYNQHVEGVGDSSVNVFHNRFSEFATRCGLPLSVRDLLFVCVQTDRETDKALVEGGVTDLLEHVLMRICRPPFSLR